MTLESKPHLKYHLLDDESEKGETDNFLSQRSSSSDDGPRSWYKPQQLRMRSMLTILPWVLSSVLAALCLVLLSKLQRISGKFGSYEAGFHTDMSKLYDPNLIRRPSIQLYSPLTVPSISRLP